jgi:hypothetical protein
MDDEFERLWKEVDETCFEALYQDLSEEMGKVKKSSSEPRIKLRTSRIGNRITNCYTASFEVYGKEVK